MRLLLLLLLLPGAAFAAGTRATFDVYLSGMPAGTLELTGEETGGRYEAEGVLQSGGLLGALRRIRYDAEVRGQVSSDGHAPRRYSETRRQGSDDRKRRIEYAAGVPAPSGKRRGLDPATQGGTVDPLTAIWGVLRDVAPADACRYAADIFDGSRRSRVTLGTAERDGGRVTCAGEYRRVAGYDADDMENPAFPFRLTYRDAGSRLEVERIEMRTIFGSGTLVRR